MRIILTLLFVFSIAYSYVDRQLYFYGRSDFDAYHPLPVNVKPDYWGYDLGNTGFVLVDDLDFVIVGKGSKYKTSKLIVNEVTKYSFDNGKIIVGVTDSTGREHLISMHHLSDSNIEISVDPNIDHISSNWIMIKGSEKYIKQLEWTRSIIRIILFFTIIVELVRVFNIYFRKNKHV